MCCTIQMIKILTLFSCVGATNSCAGGLIKKSLAVAVHTFSNLLCLVALLRPSCAFCQSANDAYDPSPNAEVGTIVTQADGRAIIGGSFYKVGAITRVGIARLNVDGSVDTAFDSPANGGVLGSVVQSDLKILAVGEFTMLAGQPRNFIGRLSENGNLDMNFNPGANA